MLNTEPRVRSTKFGVITFIFRSFESKDYIEELGLEHDKLYDILGSHPNNKIIFFPAPC